MNKSVFKICDTWDEAGNNTDNGLVPLAVRLVYVDDLPQIDAEIALAERHYPYVLASMTTVFSDKEMDGKLGWHPISGDLKQKISEMLHDSNLLCIWVFLSQTYSDA